MTQPKTKAVRMLANDRGCPEGHTVVHYSKDQVIQAMPEALALAFIEAGTAEEIQAEGAAVVVATWPPSDEEIEKLSFSALGVLLEGKDVALGPLKSEDARRQALREVIESEITAPWPATENPAGLSDAQLVRVLRGNGLSKDDLALLTTRDAAEAKLREQMGLPAWPPADEEIEKLGSAEIQGFLQARNVQIDGPMTDEEARAKLREQIATEQK